MQSRDERSRDGYGLQFKRRNRRPLGGFEFAGRLLLGWIWTKGVLIRIWQGRTGQGWHSIPGWRWAFLCIIDGTWIYIPFDLHTGAQDVLGMRYYNMDKNQSEPSNDCLSTNKRHGCGEKTPLPTEQKTARWTIPSLSTAEISWYQPDRYGSP